MAPMLAPVPIAARPATPAPTTRILQASNLPAAVTSPLRKRWYTFEASITLLYPAILACELRTSRLCAREIRGIASTARRLMPAAAALSIRALPSSVRGPTKLMRVLPFGNISISCFPVSELISGVLILMMTSAVLYTASALGRIFAPTSSYDVSEKPPPSPAPLSTKTSIPFLSRRFAASGTMATRFSPPWASFETPILRKASSCNFGIFAMKGSTTGATNFDAGASSSTPAAPSVAGPSSLAGSLERRRSTKVSTDFFASPRNM
mmetsp:Transcript_26994/g.58561  ORF Transcript_26994/g.58561 Transcript_26994/m.58561 type:complete len:266 (-) Transcript_26994:1586-2383(-)